MSIEKRSSFKGEAASSAKMRGLLLVALALIAVLVVSGCSSGNHKVTEGESCGGCHADGKEEVVRDSLDAARESIEVTATVGATFTVETNADTVWLCSLRFGGDDGTHAVPTRLKTLSQEDMLSVQVKDPGLYALCTGNLDSPSITIIEVDPSIAGSSTVALN